MPGVGGEARSAARQASTARDGSILYTDAQLHAPTTKSVPAHAASAEGSASEDAGWVLVMAHNAETHQVRHARFTAALASGTASP